MFYELVKQSPGPDNQDITKPHLNLDGRNRLSMFAQIFLSGEFIENINCVLDSEISREAQIDAFVEWRFNEKRNVSASSYERLFPGVTTLPKKYKGRFNIPLFIDPLISPWEQIEAVPGFVTNMVDKTLIEDSSHDSELKDPYLIWVNCGSLNRNKSAKEVLTNLASDEAVLSFRESVALVSIFPQILSRHSIDIPGATVKAGSFGLSGVFYPEIRKLASKMGNVHLQYNNGSAEPTGGAPTKTRDVITRGVLRNRTFFFFG